MTFLVHLIIWYTSSVWRKLKLLVSILCHNVYIHVPYIILYLIGDAYMFAGGLSKSPFIQTKYGSFTPAEAVAGM